MTYIDTSSLLKLLFNEKESDAVRLAVAAEDDLRVSSLTQLEARVQLKAAWLGGDCTKAKFQAFMKQLDSFRYIDPFHFVSLSGSVFEVAIQHDAIAGKHHLRTLDRLHLAAMDELGISRLMTNDIRQAERAQVLGMDVTMPL